MIEPLTRNLIHSLHPRSQDHASKQPTRPAARDELPPRIAVEALSVQDVFDDIELSLHRRRVGRCTMALKRSEDLSRFVVLSLADQETGTVWQEWAETPDADGEEDLEG